MNRLITKLLARLGYTPTANLAESQRLLLVEITRVHHYEEMLCQSQNLTQRGIRVIETLRKVNKELAEALNRVQAAASFEMRARSASGIGPFEVVNEATYDERMKRAEATLDEWRRRRTR